MKTAFNFLACFLLVALSISLTIPARAQDIAPEEEIAYHPLTGLARYIGAPESGRPIKNASALEKSDTFQQAALSFLDQRGAIFGLNDPHAELTLLRESDSSNGNHAVRYQQTYQGIPVLAGEIIIHLDSRKNILSANGEALSKIDLDTTPLIGLDAATQAALSLTAKYQQLDEATLQASPPELWIYNPALLAGYDGPSVLVWRIEVTPRAGLLYPVRQLVLVNAQRGGLVLTFNQIGDARNRLTFNANGDDNEGSLPGSLVCQENEPCLNPPDAAAAHLYAGNTYDFYYNLHGRDSIDNHGMNIISTVNFGLNFENAFWNGDQMVYGAGFASADDVVAHELTHGVTQYESNLFYYWQSGAINESLSDVWGEFVDLKNGEGNDSDSVRWLIGENLPASIGVIRSMKNPPAYLDPDKISSPRYYLGDADSGGVHYNSGVNNKAVYLMTDGDTFNNYTISGIGIEKTAHIYYYVQTNLLTSAADYADLYYAVQTACAALTGTHGITQSDCQQVQKALDAVEMNLQLPSYNPDTSACASPYVAYNHFLDDLENGSANWISEEIVGSQRWAYGSPYGDFSHSGKGFLYAIPSPLMDYRRC